jgi:dihydroflavonol-4-reductase
MAGTVLVTGGSGYIAGFLIRQLVTEGWTVRTTLRSLAREADLRARLQVDDARLTVFAADLTDDAGWDDAAAGCSHVAHVASPLPTAAPKDENELIVPARDGALRVLRAARAAGARRFVMTSSVAAIAYGHPKSRTRFTEADWSDPDGPGIYAYPKSKTLAERAAREWVAAEGGALEFVTVNPSVVLGPIWTEDFSASIQAVKKLLGGEMPGVPDIGFGIVDVRDVADLHVRCLTAPDLAGERFIAAGPFLKLVEVGRILREELGEEARRVPTLVLPDMMVKLAAKLDPVIAQVTSELGRVKETPATHAAERLGWAPRPAAETIVATARSLIDLGIVKV